jgi:hypothetical protein
MDYRIFAAIGIGFMSALSVQYGSGSIAVYFIVMLLVCIASDIKFIK